MGRQRQMKEDSESSSDEERGEESGSDNSDNDSESQQSQSQSESEQDDSDSEDESTVQSQSSASEASALSSGREEDDPSVDDPSINSDNSDNSDKPPKSNNDQDNAPSPSSNNTMRTVDLDALEEERIQHEEQVLSFTIFTKRKALDPLHDALFDESAHEVEHKVEDLHAEAQDTDLHLDSLVQNFQSIATQLESTEGDEALLNEHEDHSDHSYDGEEDDKPKGDNHDNHDKANEKKEQDDEDIHQSLAAMVREHAGEDALPETTNDNAAETCDSEEEEEEDHAMPALPDFSSFKEEVEKTLKKKSKRVSGQSQLESIMSTKQQNNNRDVSPQPPSRRRVRRVKTLPSRPGEDHLFFDWRNYAAANNNNNSIKDGPPDQSPPQPTRSLENDSNNIIAPESTPVPSTMNGFKADSAHQNHDSNNITGVDGISTTKIMSSGNGNGSGNGDSTTSTTQKPRKKIGRSKTAPTGTLFRTLRPGEEFFDWKKFAAEHQANQYQQQQQAIGTD